MDSPRERLLAALLGGVGTLVGVLLIQVIPQMTRYGLKVHQPNAIWFILMLLAVGGTGGFVGHWLFLYTAKGPIEGRAVTVGTSVGATIGLVTWAATFFFPRIFFPFAMFSDAIDKLRPVITQALLGGAVGGLLAALAVVRRLRKITGKTEPLEG